MLPKLLFCALLVAWRTVVSDGADYNQQTSAMSPKLLDLPSFDGKTTVGQPTTIDHKSFIEHVAGGTGSSPTSAGSSHQHSTGTRSSTLLNKAIAEQGAISDPVIQPSSYTNVQAIPPNFSNDLAGISSLSYANSGILSPGLFGTSIDKIFGSNPSVISLNSHIDHTATESTSSARNGIPSFNNNKDLILSAEFLNPPFDKMNTHVPVPEVISVSVSSSTDEGSSRSIPSSPVNIPTVNYAHDGILSPGLSETSLSKDVISNPNKVSLSSVNVQGVPGSISTVADSVSRQKIPSSVGPAESSFLSSIGAIIGKPSVVSAPNSISLAKIPAVQNEASSVNHPTEKVFAGSIADQSTISNPTALTSQTSIEKFLSTPASDVFGYLSNGYNDNPSGILSSGFLGAPIASIFELNGKELSANGLFSESNIVNNRNFAGGLISTPAVGDKDDTLNKFETVIQHTTPTNTANPKVFNGINDNNLFNIFDRNGIITDPLGFPNGLFGNTYNGLNNFGGENFAGDNIFAKYFWR